MSPGRWSALPHLSSHAAIASGSRCYLPISSASCDLADLDCGARAAHKMSSHSGLLRRTFAGLPSSLLDRRRQQSCAQRDQRRTLAPPLINMPPASNASPLHKGRGEETHGQHRRLPQQNRSKGDIATELKSARLADTRQDAEGAEGFPDSGSVEAITPYGTSVINGLPFSTTRVARAFTRDVPLLMPSWILLASMYNESPAL